MDYKLYRFVFQGAVHFGRQNLDEGEYTCCADTVFSALCQEALKAGGDVLQSLYGAAKEGKLLLSDAFPYMGGTFFLPKPIKHIDFGERAGDSTVKKAFKRLKYIPADMLDIYLQGGYDIMAAPDLRALGDFEMKTVASIRGEEETRPYRVGTFYYHPGNGLYLIAGYEGEEIRELLEKLLRSLSFSGLGGKRASGFGRFVLSCDGIPAELKKRLEGTGTGYMTLSAALPTDEEMETVMGGAEYLLSKRSGFISSENYAEEQMRKRDLYVFRAGSCFSTRFCGDIYDVSDGRGRHPVYRYAKPMLMEV